jgi:hypothetical protein
MRMSKKSLKLTKAKLRKKIHEIAMGTPQKPFSLSSVLLPTEDEAADPNIPKPEDYERVREFLEGNPELEQFGMEVLMDLSGSTCPVSTRQALIDHLVLQQPGSTL